MTVSAVRAEVDARRDGVRLLEIGAGTGSTSERVFARLTGRDLAEYRYTDISKAFLIDAERRFVYHVPYVSFSTFDVGRSPAHRDSSGTLRHRHRQQRPARHPGHRAGGTSCPSPAAARRSPRTQRAGPERLVVAPHLRAPRRVVAVHGRKAYGGWTGAVLGRVARRAAGVRVRHGRAPGGARPGPGPADTAGARLLPVPRRDPRPAATGSLGSPGSIEEHVRATVERILAETLKLTADELAADKPFADYGLDSLTGVSLVQRLNESLSTDLDPSVLFENPSIRRLTRFIVDEEGAAITVAVPGPFEVPEASAVTVPSAVREVSAVTVPSAVREVSAVSEASAVPEPSGVTRPSAVPGPSGGGREPVAIVGMSGRFPGARDTDEFWDLLASGRDAVSKVDRWDLASLGSACLDGGLLDGVDEFDPLFFGISGAEALYMEPQQRLFLQEAWRALEDAGHAGESLDRDRCGIYVGCAAGDYLDLTGPSDYPGQALWGNMNSLVPSRIAYYLDLHG